MPIALLVAYSGGVAVGDCSGCHGAGDHSMSVTTMPSSFMPGQEVRVRVTVSGSGAVAGIFINADAGSFSTIPGQGLSQVDAGLTHNQPKPIQGGNVTFEFDWTAPGSPGAVRFAIVSVVANGNGGSGGDGAADDDFDFVFGCQGQQHYRDLDGDGFGRDEVARLFCAGEGASGWVPAGGDCDDNRDTVFPGAVEYCNLRDDDCDGEIDEDALPVLQYPDADGDLYYGAAEWESGKTFSGCVPTKGWAPDPGDCRPDDPMINPGMEEVCNGWDDNCDARIDEFVRPRCGEGWCTREAQTCDEATCTPGEPREEECNLLDDDCDGLVDEDSCPDGQVCRAGVCEAEGGEGSESGSASGSASDSASASASDGGSEGGVATATDTDGAAANGDAGCGCAAAGVPAWWAMFVLAIRRRRR